MRKGFQGLAVAILVLFATGFASAYDRIEGGLRCESRVVVFQGQSTSVEVFGQGMDFAEDNHVTVSGSNVTATITKHHNGAENQLRGKGLIGSIELRITATATAGTGDRTITLHFPTGATDTVPVKVVRPASINNATYPTLSGPFETVDITFTGVGLSNAGVTAQLKRDSSSPLRDAAGQDVPGSQSVYVSATKNVQTNTDDQVVVTVRFYGPGNAAIQLTQATVEVTLRSSGCNGLAAFGTDGLKRTITITAPLGKNYVQSITFPYGSTVSVGSLLTIEVRLLRPATAPLLTIGAKAGGQPLTGGSVRLLPQGEVVYWQFDSPQHYEGTATTSYSTTAKNQLVIPWGNQTGQITVRVKSCPGNGLNVTGKLQTWMHNQNTYQPPEYKEAQFTVSCSP